MRPVGIACSLAFALGTAARAASIPAAKYWSHHYAWPYIWIATGLITGARYVIVDRDRQRRKRKAAMDDACREVAAHIDKCCPTLALRYVGVQIRTVARPWFGHAHLRHASHFFIEDRRPSSVGWTPGKGVFGLAWKEKAPVIMDLDAALYQHARSRADFEALPAGTKLGFTWDEMRRTQRYKVVYAAPLFDRHETDPSVIGMLSVDCLETGHYDELSAATFDNHDFNNDVLALCEAAVIG